MEAIIFYLGKTIFASGILYLYYRIFLKEKTFHHYNRYYLLTSMFVSLLLPLVKISDFTIEVTPKLFELMQQLPQQNTNTISHDTNYFTFILLTAGLVSVFFAVRFFVGILKISHIQKHYPKQDLGGINFYLTDLNNAPFSYFRNLFWKKSIDLQSPLGKQILKHEMVHIEQKHSIDKILLEILKSIFWFNPFFYLMRKEIHLIHEYLADKKALHQSDTKAFAQMLLASHFSGKVLPATSPFLNSNLKKRIQMLKKTTTKYSYARRIFALPLLFMLCFFYLVNAKNKEIRATNLEIEKAIIQWKTDTIKPNKQLTENNSKLTESHDLISSKLDTHSQKIATLGKNLQKKSEELKKLDPNSKAFSDKVEEINNLSGKIADIANSEDYQTQIKILNLNDINFDRNKLKDVQEKLNSKDFKVMIAKNKELLNSKEWKDQIKNLEDIKFDNLDFSYGEDGTFIFKNQPEIFFDTDQINAAVKKGKLSEEDAKKLEKLAKEKADLAMKQVNISKKMANIAKNNAEIANKERNVVVLSGEKPSTMFFNTQDILNNDISKDAEVYINGKSSTIEELKKLNPKSIKNINIHKKKSDNKDSTLIKIETK